MTNLPSKYAKLKKMVGGNREKMSYEETFGMPQEEFWHITMPNKWTRRILAEVEFCIRLSKENDYKFDNSINNALEYLQKCMDEDGVLTKSACLEAEKMILICKDAAKEYNLILAAHAHIDMNWMWGWQETVAATLATFRTMLNIMDEYPEFCFSQSQASVYKIVEDYDPALMERIKQRIQEGRWEITATAWVETDKNMPNTESLLKHIKYTRDYLQEHWNVDPASLEIDFSPDTFGHSANIPELNQYADVKYYYHCRGLAEDHALYRWFSPSGKEVLAYREQYWYNSGITPYVGIGLIEVSKRCAGLKTGLVVYGVGDHGGGPTRRDVERAIEMNEWPVFPSLRFGTLREFFKIAETVKENLPIVKHELNFIFPGCYTTQSRIKMGNRHNEIALSDAQCFSSLAHKELGAPYMEKQFENAWQNVLFTHFHDILTGSCVQETREHAMGLYAHSMAIANTQHSNATRMISEQIDTSFVQCDEDISDTQSEGAGVGFGLSNYAGVPSPERGSGRTRIFNIFNSSAHSRTQTAELTVWDWTGDMRYINIEGVNGEEISFQLLDTSLQNYWDHKYFRFLVNVTVPACGYTTIVLKEYEPEEYKVYFKTEERTNQQFKNFVLENEYIKAEFDYQNGSMISLVDKASGKEQLQKGKVGGLRFIETELGTSNAWQIGRYTDVSSVTKTVKIANVDCGNLRQGFEIEQTVQNSVIKSTITLDKDAKALTYRFKIDWHEISRNGSCVPVLAYFLPLQNEIERYLYDIPGGAQYREAMNIDVPALQYAAAISKDKNAVAIITDCKYGYRGIDNTLVATLINATTYPDPYPERGIHNIVLSVAVCEACPKVLEELATDINHPFNYQPTNSHKGTLPAQSSLLNFESETAVVSGIFTSSDGDLMVRVYETCGKETNVKITLPNKIQTAITVDLMEKPNCEKVIITDNCLSFVLKPYSIQTIKIK